MFFHISHDWLLSMHARSLVADFGLILEQIFMKITRYFLEQKDMIFDTLSHPSARLWGGGWRGPWHGWF